MVDQRGRDQLPQQHEEHRVADPEGGRDKGDGEDVERHQHACQEQVPGLAGQARERLDPVAQGHDQGGREGHHEEDQRGGGG